jgi:hypothetical protein
MALSAAGGGLDLRSHRLTIWAVHGRFKGLSHAKKFLNGAALGSL